MNASDALSRAASQKLVTIYLDNSAYGKGKVLIGSYADKHGLVEEHLSDQFGRDFPLLLLSWPGDHCSTAR